MSSSDAHAARADVAAAVDAELKRLHVTLSFASPSSHLYHEAATNVTDRPPAGARLSARSNLQISRPTNILQQRHEVGMNKLGRPIAVDAFGATSRDIVARGGIDAAAVLAVAPDAELRALTARLAAQPVDPEMAGTLAHEIMKRDTVRGVIRVISGGVMNSTYRETFPPHPEGYVKRTSRR
jgi:hypothetical protein